MSTNNPHDREVWPLKRFSQEPYDPQEPTAAEVVDQLLTHYGITKSQPDLEQHTRLDLTLAYEAGRADQRQADAQRARAYAADSRQAAECLALAIRHNPRSWRKIAAALLIGELGYHAGATIAEAIECEHLIDTDNPDHRQI